MHFVHLDDLCLPRFLISEMEIVVFCQGNICGVKLFVKCFAIHGLNDLETEMYLNCYWIKKSQVLCMKDLRVFKTKGADIKQQLQI